MGPDLDESFNQETHLEGFQSFIDPTDSAGHFTRTVYVMRLHINCKPCMSNEGERGGEREGGGEEGKEERRRDKEIREEKREEKR